MLNEDEVVKDISPHLFMVTVSGMEEVKAVVVAENKEQAMALALRVNTAICELILQGYLLLTLDLTEKCEEAGYSLIVMKKGIFH